MNWFKVRRLKELNKVVKPLTIDEKFLGFKVGDTVDLTGTEYHGSTGIIVKFSESSMRDVESVAAALIRVHSGEGLVSNGGWDLEVSVDKLV